MSGTDWRTLAGFGVLVIGVNYLDHSAAMVLLGLVAVVAIFKHPAPLTKLFGGSAPAAG